MPVQSIRAIRSPSRRIPPWKTFSKKVGTDNLTESHAQKHAEQHLGCVACKSSHHTTSYCECGRCFFQGEYQHDDHFGTFVKCKCGKVSWWD